MKNTRGGCEVHAGRKPGGLRVAPQSPHHGQVAQRKSVAGASRGRPEVQVLPCPPIFSSDHSRGECEAHAGRKPGSLWVAPQPPHHGQVAQLVERQRRKPLEIGGSSPSLPTNLF